MASIIASFSVIFSTLLAFLGLTVSTYDTPVDEFNGGDPFIVEDETGCYYTYTTGGGVTIRKIKAYNDTTVLEEKEVYTVGNNGILHSIWAPEIHKIGDRWYIVSCAVFDKAAVERGKMPDGSETEEHDDYYRYGFVLESKSDDIFGEYEFMGILAPNGLNNIDGTYLKKDGKLYYISSAYHAVGTQCIYISEMENPYTLKSTQSVMLSKPEYAWEKKGWQVNEGPAVLYNEDDTYIVYSASGYSSGDYCMGMLTLKGNDPMNARHWSKSPVRVHYHQPKKSIYSAGHCSFLYRDNGEIFMVYHATKTKAFFDSPRITYIKPVQFVFGKPWLW